MSVRNQKTFTDDEMIAAFAILLPPDRAREEGLAFNALPDLRGFAGATPEQLALMDASGPRSYDGDLLDLLSLVSESCALRAWAIMGVSPTEGAARREAFRRRITEARRGDGGAGPA